MLNPIAKNTLYPCLIILVLSAGTEAFAQNRSILIRDAETESIIRSYSAPLFRAAGLIPENVGVRLILDPSLNAFVTRGQNIFIHTGLLLETKDVNEVIGVIAHETGHIEGGHLARTSNAARDAGTIGLVGTVMGVGAGLLTGRGDVAAAAAAGGQQAARRSFARFSQTQESAADHAGLRLLETTGTSARGLLRFLQVLEDQTLLSADRQSPYLRTHPLTRERIETIENHLLRSSYTDTPPPAETQRAHERVIAKLYAYIHPFETVLYAYPETDQSVAARYARAFAYYKKPDLPKALELIDGLIGEFPEDPYFNELKGEMLFDHGRIKEAVTYYQRAADLAQNSALIYLELGQALVALGDVSALDRAIENLTKSLTIEPGSSFAWHQLAIAYGRMEKFDLSALALAEEAMLQGRFRDAIYHAGKAETLLPAGSQERLQASDIINAAQNRIQ